MISQWCASRSRGDCHLRIDEHGWPHSPNARFVVATTDVRSQACRPGGTAAGPRSWRMEGQPSSSRITNSRRVAASAVCPCAPRSRQIRIKMRTQTTDVSTTSELVHYPRSSRQSGNEICLHLSALKKCRATVQKISEETGAVQHSK